GNCGGNAATRRKSTVTTYAAGNATSRGLICSLVCLARAYDLVDQAKVLRLIRAHEMVAVERALDRVIVPAGMLDVNLVEPALQLDDVLGMALDVGRLTLEAAG